MEPERAHHDRAERFDGYAKEALAELRWIQRLIAKVRDPRLAAF